MDHYKVLGVRKNASKEEIKQAFRELTKQFHPDKHSQSSKHSRDSATFKFKQLSEAYETLIDDRKRADYNISINAYGAAQNKRYDYARDRGGGRIPMGMVMVTVDRRVEALAILPLPNLRWVFGISPPGVFSAMLFLQGLYFTIKWHTFVSWLVASARLIEFSILLGGMYIVDTCGKALWKMHNPGKSFEEATESVKKSQSSRG